MNAEVEIKVALKWELEESTGEKCCACGKVEPINNYRIIFILNGKEKSTDYVFCIACTEKARA